MPSSLPASDPTGPPTSEHADPLSDDEFDELMRSSSPAGNVEDENEANSNPLRPTGIDDDEANILSSSIGPIRNELALSRRLGDAADLKPYQKTTLETFVKANIKSVVVAVLLSSKLSSYKGDLPKEAVLAVLLRDRLHIPSTFDRDTNVSNTIEAAIKEELTQCRSKIKKLIRWSVIENKSIFMLGTKVVKDTRCTVTVPLCGKLALLRKVYGVDNGSKFWDKVDIKLEKLRLKAAGNPAKIDKVFNGLLDADHKRYPQTPQESSRMAAEGRNPNEWQSNIDTALSTQTVEES